MRAIGFVVLAVLVASCGSSPVDTSPADSTADLDSRIAAIATHVRTWGRASTVEEASAEAEAAANLVLGPHGPGYGDLDGDGEVGGSSGRGLLPGVDGASDGLVIDTLGQAACVERDVLGGPWDDPGARWREMTEAIEAWGPEHNTFPSLDSHLMRIVGWATLTQGATLEQAHAYAGHAALHVDVVRAAIDDC